MNNDFEMAISKFNNFRELSEQFYEIQPILYDTSSLWWLWDRDKCKWGLVDETDILIKIDKSIDYKINTSQSKVKNELLEHLKKIGRVKWHEIKKPEKTWVQFGNFIYDVVNKQKIQSSADYFVTNPIEIEVGEFEDTPTIDALFKEWVGEKYVDTLYEIIAFCCLPSYPIQTAFCFIGSGSNGKSTYLDLLSNFIGFDNTCSTELDYLMENRFEVAKLYKKLVCQMGETNFTSIKKTSLLKKLVSGNDLIGFEFKNKKPFDDYNYAKILISTNSLPITFDKTMGFYRRWQILEFKNQFPKQKDILSTIPDEEYKNLARKCLKVLNKLIESKEFTNQGDFEERKKKYEENSNPFMPFLNENFERNNKYEITFWEFYEEFMIYLRQRGHRELSRKAVSNLLQEEGFEIPKNPVKLDNKSVKVIIGLVRKKKENIKITTDTTDTTDISLSSCIGKSNRKSVELVESVENTTYSMENKCQTQVNYQVVDTILESVINVPIEKLEPYFENKDKLTEYLTNH